jgi:DNA primase
MNRTVVEQIKERLPVNEVIGQYLKLEKSGNAYKAKCPFHNEKSPSFFVSPDRGGYYCFGCNAKGDIFTFVEQFEGLDFRGALKVLAERAGVQLTFDKKADGERDRLFDIMEAAASYFEAEYIRAKDVQDYVKKRGITDTTREEFRIGWAPEGWQSLIDHLRVKKFSDSLIEKAGLGKKTDEGKFYDRFRGRVMFPIFDSSGRVIAFSGRILKDDGKSAKYLNSPDTPLYDKSMVLYGLDKAKSDIRRMNYTIMVEGQMDLVMSHQAGIKNTVASSGTALTDESFSESGAVSNLGLVRRLSPNVIIAFDSDSAGRKAAMRAAGIALSMGMDVKIADLVGGKDPADLVLHNPEDWKNALRSAKPIIEFELGNVMRDVPDSRKVGRALRERVFPFLARIESRMDQAHFVKMISDKTNIPETAVWDDLKNVKVEQAKGGSASEGRFGGHEGGREPAAPSADGDSVSRRRGAPGAGLDLIERRLFGLLSLIEKTEPKKGAEYRAAIKKIADASYDMRWARIEPMLGDVAFEAEAFFGSALAEWDRHMKELIANFEQNMVNEELLATMNELRQAEKIGDTAKVAELAKKCQVLSIRKGEIGKRMRD